MSYGIARRLRDETLLVNGFFAKKSERDLRTDREVTHSICFACQELVWKEIASQISLADFTSRKQTEVNFFEGRL